MFSKDGRVRMKEMVRSGSLRPLNDLMRARPKQVLSPGVVIWRRFRTVTSAHWALWGIEDPAAVPSHSGAANEREQHADGFSVPALLWQKALTY